MDRKLELAFTKLKDSSNRITSAPVVPAVAFSNNVGWQATNVSFDAATSAWSDDAENIYIYNLNYTLKSLDYTGSDGNTAANGVADRWDAVPIPQRIFPPMGADRFLVRVVSPGQGLGKKLMYQVLVSRDSSVTPYKVTPLTFQEVWYE